MVRSVLIGLLGNPKRRRVAREKISMGHTTRAVQTEARGQTGIRDKTCISCIRYLRNNNTPHVPKVIAQERSLPRASGFLYISGEKGDERNYY